MSLSRAIILVAAILLVAVGAVALIDYTRMDDKQDALAACLRSPGSVGCEKARDERASAREGWEDRRLWYAFTAAAIVVLGLTGAFVFARRRGDPQLPAT
jgi:hypothetical protein